MRIGVDIDGVLAEFYGPLLEYYNAHHRTAYREADVNHFELSRLWGCSTEEAVAEFNAFFQTEHFRRLPPVKGAITALSTLARDNDLYIITARPSHVKTVTEDWLAHHFGDIMSDCVFTNHFDPARRLSKMHICREKGIHWMIEDSLDFAIECAENRIDVLLLNRPWNQTKTLHPRIHRVHGWEEILTRLVPAPPLR
ncbi:MAG: hypothetical protein Q8P05_02205 [Candidatus Diapherotrites archaeon]|nr:hypothetical protein [Candidatus Diapherotrites archaeon]MDZ4256323.1 hypothetical protein [archaeon]